MWDYSWTRVRLPSAPLNDHRNSIRITVVFFYVKCVIYSIDKGENV